MHGSYYFRSLKFYNKKKYQVFINGILVLVKPITYKISITERKTRKLNYRLSKNGSTRTY